MMILDSGLLVYNEVTHYIMACTSYRSWT